MEGTTELSALLTITNQNLLAADSAVFKDRLDQVCKETMARLAEAHGKEQSRVEHWMLILAEGA